MSEENIIRPLKNVIAPIRIIKTMNETVERMNKNKVLVTVLFLLLFSAMALGSESAAAKPNLTII